MNKMVLPLAATLTMMSGGAMAHDGEEGGGHLIPHHIAAGLGIEGGVTWFLQGTDGNDNGTGDALDLTYTFDLSVEARVSNSGKVVAAFEAGNGNGVDARLGSLSTANYDAFVTDTFATDQASGVTDINSPNLSQLYYEGEYLDGRLVVDFGKLDVHSMYDDNAYANDETDQFLSAIFTRSPGTSFSELDRYYAPGVAASFAAGEQLDLTFILANGNGAGFDAFGNRPYGVVQANVKPVFGGLDGNYRFYVIQDQRRYHKIAGASVDTGGNISGTVSSNTAWGVSFDQALPGEVGVFARYSNQKNDLAENSVESVWSLGASASGANWGREDDAIGLGYGQLKVNNDPFIKSQMGVTNQDDESHVELYYKLGFSDHFTLTPDIQVITNNSGNADSATVTVYGVRGQLSF